MITALVDCLAASCQTGNIAQVEALARSMLAAIPDNAVALQFLGLAFYQTGRVDDAHRVFEQVANQIDSKGEWDNCVDPRSVHIATFRAATQVDSGLAEGWRQIVLALTKFGFKKLATRAYAAASEASGLTAVKHRRSTDEDRRLRVRDSNPLRLSITV